MNKTTYSLQIVHDESPCNPFEDWDSNPPLMYVYQSYITHYGTESLAKTLLDTISDHKLIHLWSTIDTINSNILDLIDFTENKKPYNYTKAEYMREQLLHGNDLTEIEALQLICDLTKTPYLASPSRGYSQGDYIDTIIVLSPEFFTRTGCDIKDATAILKITKQLFDAYIWGDCYGYQLIEHKPLYTADGTLSTETEDNIIDSCYGFYGDDGLKEIYTQLPEEYKPLHAEAIKHIIY